MKIKCAAILYDGKIYEGKSHSEIGIKMIEDGVCEIPYPSGENQGFVTDSGKYVNREEAMIIACNANQIKVKRGNKLFSEDLI